MFRRATNLPAVADSTERKMKKKSSVFGSLFLSLDRVLQTKCPLYNNNRPVVVRVARVTRDTLFGYPTNLGGHLRVVDFIVGKFAN